MRFSSLLVAAFLLVSAILLAQHSAGAGASSSAGSASSGASHSAAVSTSSSSSSVSHSSSSSPSHVAHASGGAPHQRFPPNRHPQVRHPPRSIPSRKKEVFAPFSAILSRSRCRLRRRNSIVHVGKSPARFVRREAPATVDAVSRLTCVNPASIGMALPAVCSICRTKIAVPWPPAWRSRSSGCVPWLVPSSKLVPVIPTARNAAICEPNPPAKACCMNNCEDNTSSVCCTPAPTRFVPASTPAIPGRRSCSTSSLAGELAFAGRSEGFPREASLPSSPVRTQWTVSRTSNRLQCSPPEMTASNGSRTALEDSDHGNDGNS